MHDPMVLLFSIRRPWPKRTTWRQTRLKLYWPAVVDVWHVEPKGRDSGTVCGRHPRGWRLVPWTLRHIRHLHIQVGPYRGFKRWKWQRCEHCGGPSRRYNKVNVSSQWDAGPQHWGESKPGMYHMQCSGLVHFKAGLDQANEAIRALGVTARDLELVGINSMKAFNIIYRAKPRLDDEVTA